jgi:hypothetical protein
MLGMPGFGQVSDRCCSPRPLRRDRPHGVTTEPDTPERGRRRCR